MKARNSGRQFQTCKEMMTVKSVTPDLKSMPSEGDIIAGALGGLLLYNTSQNCSNTKTSEKIRNLDVSLQSW
ncbi:hypothetical protein STEG23_021071 [Scotinomys teguina]